MKSIFAVLFITLVVTMTDREAIQANLDGLFDQNYLPRSVTIVPCIDDVSAHQIIDFGGQILDKAARGFLSDILAIPQLLSQFALQLNPNVAQCLNDNQQLASLNRKYNPRNESIDIINAKIVAYVTLHYLTVHRWLGQLDDLWHIKDYYQVGFKAAGYFHNILGSSQVQASTEIINIVSKPSHNHILKLLKELNHLIL